MKKALVLGGGFAGVESAIFLKKYNYEVTLVSDRDFFYIYPISIWVPTRKIQYKNICINLKNLKKAHGFEIIIDGVEKIEAKKHRITLQSGKILHNFDYLIIALGASKTKLEGIEHTLSICGAPQQSLQIRDKLDELIKKGSGKIAFGFGSNEKDKSAVRGGPGFELLFNVHNLLKKKGIRDKFELTFFAPMQKPGARLGKKALDTMDKIFKKNKINKSFGKKIKKFIDNKVIFEDNSELISDFIMFIPAGTGHQVIKKSDLPQNGAGFIKINDFCEVDGFDNIYAVGDVSAIEGPKWRAKQGHIAEVMARNVAYNIQIKDANKNNKKGYAKHLNILCIMDNGEGAILIYRDNKVEKIIPIPIIGHLLKKCWGYYCKLSKLGRIPRIYGM